MESCRWKHEREWPGEEVREAHPDHTVCLRMKRRRARGTWRGIQVNQKQSG